MVRHATAADRIRVLQLAKAFHAASGVRFPFSVPLVNHVIGESIAGEDRLCLVLEVGGNVDGALIAVAADHPFIPARCASEIMWWIEPASRGRHAVEMMAAYEQWAVSHGCTMINLVGLGHDPAVTRLYERRGFLPAERHFLKSI